MISLLLCAPLLSPLPRIGLQVPPPSGPGLAFSPTPQSTVAKTFTLSHALVLKTMRLDDDEGAQVSQQAFEVASAVTLGVLDTYREVGEGRPLSLRRVYEDAGLAVDLMHVDPTGVKSSQPWQATSPLVGTGVVFTWVPEEKGYGRHYDEKEHLEEYLGGLAEDLDLRCLLPGREVREGDTWTIEVARLVDLFAAGGNVPRAFVAGGGGFFARPLAAGVAGPLSEVFGGEVRGEARAKWRETRQETREKESVRLALIDLSVKIETSRDQTASTRAAMRRDEMLDERTIDHAEIQWKFEGDGTLAWNLDAGRFESLKLGGREEVSNRLELGQGGETTLRQSLELAGSLQVSATAVPKK